MSCPACTSINTIDEFCDSASCVNVETMLEMEFNNEKAVLGAITSVDQNGMLNGYDGYVLGNDSLVFYYPGEYNGESGQILRRTLPLPSGVTAQDVLYFGAVRYYFYVVTLLEVY